MFGSLVTQVALPLTAVLALGATPAEMGLLAALEILPGIAIGLIAGVWVDRLRRRPVLIAADLGRAALLGTIPVAAWLGTLRIEQLYVVALLAGTLTVFFDVAYQSYLPALVRREELVEANSKLEASAAAAEVAAFGLGGVLVQTLTGPVAILLDALSFLVSALAVGAIRTPEPPPAPATSRQGVLREIGEGLRAIRADPVLRALAAATVTLELSFRLVGTVYMLYVSRELGFPPALIGGLAAIGGAASFLGALAAGRVPTRWGAGPVLAVALLVSAGSLLCLPLAAGAGALAAPLLGVQQLGDAAMTFFLVNALSLRQARTPARLQGRVNASVHFAAGGAMLLGALLGGLFGERLGLRATLVLAAFGVLASALWLLPRPVRRLRLATSGEGLSA
jgi:MFS family permease